MNYESLIELVKKRRTVRKFKPDPIPDDYVGKIIEAACWAPSGANSQPWEFIVVKKQHVKDCIVKICWESDTEAHRIELTRERELIFPAYAKPRQQPWGFANSPVFIILCGDPRTKDAYPLSANLHCGQSIFTSSLANAFLYMNLAAATLGLGAQWVTVIARPYVQSLVKDLLGVPRELEFYDMMAVGYPASEPKPRLVRAKEETIHYDCYDKAKFRTDDKVRDYIIKSRARAW
ncbi:nitroreductase family protein [Chloroflexota bacterium]